MTSALSQGLPFPEQVSGSVASMPAKENLMDAVGHETPLTTMPCAAAGTDAVAAYPANRASIVVKPKGSLKILKRSTLLIRKPSLCSVPRLVTDRRN